jgi:hypothetical protein
MLNILMEENTSSSDVSYHGCRSPEKDLMNRDMDLIERVRTALLQAATHAYEDACIRGLCSEGAFEVAIGAMRQLELGPLLGTGEEDPARQRLG